MHAKDSDNSELQQLLRKATNTIEILEGNKEKGSAILRQMGISPRTLLGTLTIETGGILFDHGWLRFLGAGSKNMHGNLLNWNSLSDIYGLQDAFIVAYDVIGGIFAMNGGAFPGKNGSIFYMAPEKLSWQCLGGSYSQLFSWAMIGNLEQFYSAVRWPGWQSEVSTLSGDQGLSIIPFLWTEVSEPLIRERSRRVVPMRELWNLEQDLIGQVRHLPSGTAIKIHFT